MIYLEYHHLTKLVKFLGRSSPSKPQRTGPTNHCKRGAMLIRTRRLATGLHPHAPSQRIQISPSLGRHIHTLGWGLSIYTEKAIEIVKAPITEIIPRFGLPRSLQSDNGPSFKATVTERVSKALGTDNHLHRAWQPQSFDSVEKTKEIIESYPKRPAKVGPLYSQESSFANERRPTKGA